MGDEGYWKPEKPATYPPFLTHFPPPLAESLAFLVEFYFPWHLLWPLIAYVCWYNSYIDLPSIAQGGAIYAFLYIFLRNEILLWAQNGFWHYLLYIRKIKNLDGKYLKSWDTKNKKFLFGDQVYDNVFWCSTSGVFVWTVYEFVFLQQWARGNISTVYFDFWSRPFYSLFLLALIPWWRHFHFYWVHRLIHIPVLYKACHYLHHKNKNPMPWSGLSMHPLEHVFYYSGPLIYLFIPHHPIHMMYEAIHAALSPAGGHSGFNGPVFDGKLAQGSYHHFLHHWYFECNYGTESVPLDKWFGTFRDGDKVGTKLQSKEHK